MKKIRPRVPEGEAIEDEAGMTMEQYSEFMKNRLGGEYERFSENVIDKVNPDHDSRVLEIGPGPGWAGISLLKKRHDLKLYGLEASDDMIRVAKENANLEGISGRCEYIKGVAEDMHELKDASYDLVISRDSLHHWTEPGEAFLEIKRVLKPGGKVYIQDSRRDMNFFGRMIVRIFSRFLSNDMGKYWKSSIAASYTPNEIDALLKNAKCAGWFVISDLMDLAIIKK